MSPGACAAPLTDPNAGDPRYGNGSPRTGLEMLPRARRSGGWGRGTPYRGYDRNRPSNSQSEKRVDPGQLAPPAMTVSDRGRGCR